MPDIQNYVGREQAYVKHFFLEKYLDSLLFKVGHIYSEIAYVDGFAGPWQSQDERFLDTSFGIALGKLRQVKENLARSGRKIKVRAILVEQDAEAFARLQEVPARYPDIAIETLHGDFIALCPRIKTSLRSSFAFVFVDPKGFAVDTAALATLISRENCEVVFNLMFEFINRFKTLASLAPTYDRLYPGVDWRSRIDGTPATKHEILACFKEALSSVGKYPYCMETTILKPVANQHLYSLIYTTRHPAGVEVFRDVQIKAMYEQAATRANTGQRRREEKSHQAELFQAAEFSGQEIDRLLNEAKLAARERLLADVPEAPKRVRFGDVATAIMADVLIRRVALGDVAAELRKSNELVFPTWLPKQRKPKDADVVQLP